MAFNLQLSLKVKVLMVFAFVLLGGFFVTGGKAYADCGVTSGNVHDFAGLAVGVQAVDANGNPDNNANFGSTNITVDTQLPSYSNSNGTFNPSGNGGDNLYNLYTGTRDDHKSFTPRGISTGGNCPNTGVGIVLGNNGKTPDQGGSYWELDCDYSYRIEQGANLTNPYQKFAVYPNGRPSFNLAQGANPSAGYWTVQAFHPGNGGGGLPPAEAQSANGGQISSGNPQVVSPANGATASFVLVYHEPPGHIVVCTECSGTPGCPACHQQGCDTDCTGTATCTLLDIYNYGDYTTTDTWTDSSGNKHTKTIDHATRTLVTTNGANNVDTGGPVSAGVPDNQDHSGGSTNKVDKQWHLSFTGPYYTYTTQRQYLTTDNNWANIDSPAVQTHGPVQQSPDCHEASCYVNSITGNGPGGIVTGTPGSQMNVTVTFTNSGVLRLVDPALTGSGGTHSLGFDVYPGEAPQVTFSVPAAANVSFYPDYGYNLWPGGGSCTGSTVLYYPFTVIPHAQSDPAGTSENPGSVSYQTYIENDSGVAATVPTQSYFSAQPYGGGKTYPTGIIYSSGPWGPGNPAPPGYTLNGSYPVPSPNAGDQYCAEIDFTGGYNTGWVGTNGNVVPTGLTTTGDHHCVTVVNEPYYKAYNSVSAGGSFSSGGGTCTGGGLLAGWNDNDPNPDAYGTDRGAGSTLSALALVKITGFASAQTTISRSQTGLTFANTNAADISTSKESPSLGGNYDPGGSHCLPTASPPSGTSYQAGPYPQSGITNFSGSQSLFVNGDVRITGNITYANNTAVANAPSYVVHATGNIYIDPGVTRLDGEYISDHKIYTCDNATTGGNGYGAASSSAPAPNNMFNACKNQLLIRGSFVASQVNFGRTFGSLRDEKPNPPTGGIPGGSPTSHGVVWTRYGDGPGTGVPNDGWDNLADLGAKGYACTQVQETSEPNANTWYDNYICVPGSGELRLAWTMYAGNPGVGDWGNVNSGWAPLGVMYANGYTQCVNFSAQNYGDGNSWSDNYLCAKSSQNLNMTFSPWPDGRDCTQILEDSDHDGSNQWSYGYYLCMNYIPGAPPVAPEPATTRAPFTRCSNGGTQVTTSTCAAEVFQYSPSLYISTPAILQPNSGATQYDAITSLPPVL
ncbi:MAG TPA: hypothetical protein VHB72_01405 [Candidatus Saccharimonadales bacterium]|nr:hypothetical protein [Candidatus Saccharimonadales bacterium]